MCDGELWYGAFMELKEVNLGLLVTDALDQTQISRNVYQSALGIFNNGRHCFELREDSCIHLFILRGKLVL